MEQRLRILHINSLLTGGGTDDQCIKLCAGLCELGQDVRLAGPDGQRLSELVRKAGVPLEVMPPGNNIPFICQAARVIREQRIQIVHSHHGRDYWTTLLAAWLSRTRPKIIITRHLAKSPRSLLSRCVLLGRVDALIAVSSFVAKVLTQGDYDPVSPVAERRARPPMFGNHSKIRVIPCGVDTDRFQPADASRLRNEWKLAPNHFAFGVVGAYFKPFGKGQREFLAAAAQLHREFPHARFLIIGRGDLAETLRTDIARFGLGNVAQLTPWCDDMPAAMNALDCLVHPQTATEAFGAVCIEAMACGKPVIASNLDGIPEPFAGGDHGILLPPGDIDALAGAMRRLLVDRELGRRMGAAARTHTLKNFTTRLCAERVLSLYRELCPAPAAVA